ncbi:Putative transmembrane protein (Alph_Pro_TM) [Pseudoruegeria aquimaris]|uniref:Putative transmembrane protein (Alph_Pro_TM) n=1 Tax=Pseudoruegeria aquimaris TaxID=393663 RepID=A0A1Y5SQI6_9RHOB|nr:TIGR02186 family protein [Pseudoruegeria aquimaris]SLN46111.1 Putative transmembrane protein (Alph_Pro_TM) [Pseudoruegeria aquimaris]
MLRRLLSTLLLAFATLPADLGAEEVVAGLSQNQVAITANFDGSDILIFGAVKREAPLPEGPPLEVIVAVSGPQVPVMVRRKSRQMGIWVNTDSVEVDSAPSFYAVATSAPLSEILTNTEDLRYKISTPRAIRSVGAPATISDSGNFTEALIRIRTEEELYQLLEGTVEISDQTLFSTSISLPANLTEGDYTARIFLTRDGAVVDAYETVLDVRKVGLERILYNLAHQQALLYGFLSLILAIAAGWGASAAFAALRN